MIVIKGQNTRASTFLRVGHTGRRRNEPLDNGWERRRHERLRRKGLRNVDRADVDPLLMEKGAVDSIGGSVIGEAPRGK